MQKIICVFSFMLLTVCYYTATAQTEAQLKNKKTKDSIFRSTHPDNFVPDSVPYIRKENIKRKTLRDTMHKRSDSFYYVKRQFGDSVYTKMAIAKKDMFIYRDSLSRKMAFSKMTMDTLHRKKMLYSKMTDSLHRLNKLSLFKYDSLKRMNPAFAASRKLYELKRMQMDSLRKMHAGNFKIDSFHKVRLFANTKFDSVTRLTKMRMVQSDSLRRLYNIRVDSFHRFKKMQSIRLDSLKGAIYLQNIKNDSVRVKKYLNLKKAQLQQYRDTVALKEGYRSRDLNTEITCNNGDTIFIINTYKKIVVKTVPHQRVKLSAKIDYKDELNDRDDAIFKMMGISVSRSGNKVTAIITGLKPQDNKNNNEKAEGSLGSLTKLDPFFPNVNTENNLKRTLFIEVPENAVVYLDAKYADCNIENYVKNINASINNGTLQMASAENAAIKAGYSTIAAKEIKNAHLNFSTTKFTASNIVSMTVVSTASNIQLDNCNTMDIKSVSDQYRLTTAGSISGNKDFGKLNIGGLQDQLILKGANADIKVNNFTYDAAFVNIDNKYADVKLPVYEQKNYAVYYEGSYNDVNKMSSATQKMSSNNVTVSAKASLQQDTTVATKTAAAVSKTKLEFSAGDTSGKHTKINIVCPFCNVVFN